MKKPGVWEVVKKSTIPSNWHLIGCKWVFKIKADRTHRARLVAQGFSQIPGVDYTENFAPVLKDESLQIILVCKVVKKADLEQIDVETEFLYGDLEELIFMVC